MPEARACSCREPSGARLVFPLRVDDAALNTRVRVTMASARFAPAEGAAAPVLELRSSRGELVPTNLMTTRVQDAWEDVVEMVPSSSLRPHESYVVSWLRKTRWPDTVVLGGFRTGSAEDHEAPVLAPLGAAKVPEAKPKFITSCDTHEPWAQWDAEAHDPGRPKARLGYAVWLGDSKGNVDDRAAPTVLLTGDLEIGRVSSCSPRSFPFPNKPFVWIGVAAVDEAGNRSAVQKLRVPIVRSR